MAGQRRDADVELAIRAATGDAVAFVEMVRRYDDGLRRLAFRLLGDRDVDDVLQEAYLKAFVSIPRFRGSASPRTWLYRIVYNTCLDHLRSRRREPPRAEQLEPWTRDPGEQSDLRLSLADALAALPPEECAAVLLVDAEGLSYDEAATVVGVAAGTIGSRLSRGRAALRRALREPGGVSA